MAGEAEVKFLDGDFRIVRPGAFVRCAITGVPIPLEELKYWSVDLQEAYSSPEVVQQRLRAKQAKRLQRRGLRRINPGNRFGWVPPSRPGKACATCATAA